MQPATEPTDAVELQRRLHPVCFVCSPIHDGGLRMDFQLRQDGSVQAEFGCSGAFEGYREIVHGGIVAALLDGAMTHCLFAHGHAAVTGDLHVRFRRPLRTGRSCTVRAWITRSSPPFFILEGEILQQDRLTATATAKFMRTEFDESNRKDSC